MIKSPEVGMEVRIDYKNKLSARGGHVGEIEYIDYSDNSFRLGSKLRLWCYFDEATETYKYEVREMNRAVENMEMVVSKNKHGC